MLCRIRNDFDRSLDFGPVLRVSRAKSINHTIFVFLHQNIFEMDANDVAANALAIGTLYMREYIRFIHVLVGSYSPHSRVPTVSFLQRCLSVRVTSSPVHGVIP